MPSVKRDGIFRRPGAPNYSLRLQTPGEPAFEKSLGTSDRLEAEIIVYRDYADKIAEHKAKLAARRPRIEATWQRLYEPGLHDGPNGERVAATDSELSFYSPDGKLLRTEPNGGPREQLSSVPRLGLDVPVTIELRNGAHVPTKSGDDAIMQAYLDHGGRNNRGVHGYYRREAEATWKLFRQLTNGKPLKDCDRNDGRKLVAHFLSEGMEPPTIQKRIGWLVSAVNYAIKEGKGNLTLNPFSGIAPKRTVKEKQEARRLPLDPADIELCKRNLHKLSDPDQLLFRLYATTGMRTAEAFQINGEQQTKGIRWVEVGTKTEQSWRKVPFPKQLLPYLPKAFKGPLFGGAKNDLSDAAVKRLAAAASKRLNRFLRDIGITDPRKTAYSTRHRAKDILREAECRDEIAEAIFGRDETSTGDTYGEGYPMHVLKKWIDKIGF